MTFETGASQAAKRSVGDSSSSPAQHVPCWVADHAPRFRHIVTGFDGVPSMDILTFHQRVVEAYSGIFAQLETGAFVHPVRFWAFIPGIHGDVPQSASVVAAASGRTLRQDASPDDIRSLLSSFRELRVYCADFVHRTSIAAAVGAMFPAECRIEWLRAALCRSELLVEIEGLAFPRPRP